MVRNQSIWVLESASTRRTLFAAGADGAIAAFDTSSRREISRNQVSAGWVNGLAYLASSNTLVASTSRGSLLALNADTLIESASVNTSYWFNAVRELPGGPSRRCVVTSADGIVFAWDLASGKLLEFPRRHSDQVWSCSVSEDGTRLVTCGGNGELGLWSTERAEFVSWIGRGGYTVTAVAFLSKQGRLASVDMGGLLTVWRLDDQHPVWRVAAHDARIWSIAASPDQRLLVTAGADRRVVLWDARGLHILHEIRVDEIPTACQFSGSSSVAIGDRSGKVTYLDFSVECQGHCDKLSTYIDVEDDQHRIAAFVEELPDGTLAQYSQRLIAALERSGLPFTIRRSAGDSLLKQSLSRLSGCPLFPQLYLDNRFLGGSEVVSEMVEAGTLQRLFAATPTRPVK